MDKIKSGEEFLQEFFENIDNLGRVDKRLSEELKKLYQEKKLTGANIENMIDRLIEEGKNEA